MEGFLNAYAPSTEMIMRTLTARILLPTLAEASFAGGSTLVFLTLMAALTRALVRFIF